MTPVLLPCPFCGGEAREAVGMMQFVDVEISCVECCATGGNESDGDEEANRAAAVAAWNRRVPT